MDAAGKTVVVPPLLPLPTPPLGVRKGGVGEGEGEAKRVAELIRD